MKWFFVLVLFGVELLANGVDVKQMMEKDGLYYKKGENIPFSGVMVEQDKTNNIKIRAEVFKGKMHGVVKFYNTRYGKVELESKYLNNQKNGLEKEYSMKTGKIVRETNHRNNTKDGLEKRYISGRLNTETIYHN